MPTFEIDPAVEEPDVLAFVRDYWHRQRGASAMPRRVDITPSHMKAHLPRILLADVVGEDFRYRLVGSELQRSFAGNPTGRLMSETLAAFGQDTADQTVGMYRMVVERRAPLRVRAAGALYDQSPKLVDALLTPLSDDGVTVNMIFGTFMFLWDTAFQFTLTRKTSVSDLARALRPD